MTIKAIGADSPDWSLDDLAMFIWGNEIVWGQASKIGNDGETTVVIFDSVHKPVAVDAIAHVTVVPSGTIPAGSLAFLCAGKAFVGGTKTAVSVFRI